MPRARFDPATLRTPVASFSNYTKGDLVTKFGTIPPLTPDPSAPNILHLLPATQYTPECVLPWPHHSPSQSEDTICTVRSSLDAVCAPPLIRGLLMQAVPRPPDRVRALVAAGDRTESSEGEDAVCADWWLNKYGH